MASSSERKAHYNISSGSIDMDLEASNRVDDYANLTFEHRDPNTYESLEELYMTVNLGESPNEERDTKPDERKVRTTMTRSPRKWMYIGVLTAVILLLVIAVGFIVFLLVSSKSEENSEESGSCPQYTDIENGRVVNTTGSKHGDVIEIECDEGYKLKGTNIITCTTSGVWDGLPTCKVSCGVPDIPTHASISDITGTSFQATATFKCDEGFYLDGNSEIRCQSNGLWTKDSTCKDIDDCISSNCGYGTCIDSINNYTCACTSGFAGKNCERNRKLLPTDCFDLYHFAGEKADGVYTIVTWKTHQSINLFCDMTTDGGGWTVFQHRFDGSVDFYRNFTEYEHGFGNLNTEFWLGLNYIQEISSQGQTDLRIDLESANGTRAFEKFENFYLSPYPEFTIHLGNTTDSLHISDPYGFGPYHNGMPFTTFDNDVDAYFYKNCAIEYSGAFWYRQCYYGNLNGLYLTLGIDDSKAIHYASFRSYKSLKKTKMMMKRT